ncbi:MAG: acyltransferase [Burkholderiaceae bacterium]
MRYGLSNSVVRSTRAEGLDALRFVLAFWVLAAHVAGWAATAPMWFTGALRGLSNVFQPAFETHPAVLAFIVLSGYCIHRNGLRADSLAIGPYAIRRVFRIFPIYVLAAAIGVLAGVFFLADHSISAGGLTLKLIGISAIVPSLNAITYQGNAPLHTVMVEMWLYAAYPVVILFLLRGGRERVLWAALGTVCAVGVLLCRRSPSLTDWWHNGSLPGFLLYWWIGAWFVSGRLSRRTITVAAASWVILSILLIGGWLADLVAVEARKVCFAFLIGACIRNIDKPLRVAFGRLGQAGYSLYAFHAPVVLVLLSIGTSWWLSIAGAIAVGFVAFFTVESPLTRLGKTLAQAKCAGILQSSQQKRYGEA